MAKLYGRRTRAVAWRCQVFLHGDYFDDSGSRLQPALREAAVCAFPRSRWGGDAVEHDFSVKSVTNDDESPLLRGAGVCRGA